MFLKTHKKLFTTCIFLGILLTIIVAWYAYMAMVPRTVENTNEGAYTENSLPEENSNTSPNGSFAQDLPLQGSNVEIDGTGPQGGLTICVDQCGNGECQKIDPRCAAGDVNCICSESPAECPQDCK